jgi:hypothetical protein
MSARELKTLLDQIADTRELILRHEAEPERLWSPVYVAWSDAHEDAERALGTWRGSGSGEAYAAYRAAQDREDAAQDALALSLAQ